MRAPGHPQGAFALELALDELAAKLKLDPLELRIRHNEHPVRKHQFELGRKQFDWDKKRQRAADEQKRGTRIRHGVGVAASIWGDFGRGKAVVATLSVGRDGSIELKNGLQDIGGGITTVVAQVVAEVLHRPVADIRITLGTSELGPSVGSGGSNTTSSVTPAVRAAAEAVKQQLLELAGKQRLAVDPEAATVRRACLRIGAGLAEVRRSANLFRALSGNAAPRVALLMPPLPQAWFALWGAETAGVACPINHALADDSEFFRQMADVLTSEYASDPERLYVTEKLAERIWHARRQQPAGTSAPEPTAIPAMHLS